MTHISEFSAEEAERLMALPYKVGMYVSYADDEDGEGDDQKEMQALEESIKAVAGLYETQPFIQVIADQTLNMKMEWPRWAASAFQVENEIKTAVSLLRAKASDEELKAFRTMLVEIATTVAQAHGEFSSFDEEEQKNGFGALVGKIVSGFSDISKEDENHPMNVSAAEDSAIEDIKKALRPET
ncbi:MAG: hypothetical protein AAF182_03470 [Pseudomonadota bacterium]